MGTTVAFIGYGEAARSFSEAQGWVAETLAFDRLPTRSHCATLADALADAQIVLSTVTADQTLVAAQQAAPLLGAGTRYYDLNSVAPETKRSAARAIEAADSSYIDVAVMAPVHPGRLGVPLLVSAPDAEAACAELRELGFADVTTVGSDIGHASTIKMVRSVMIKGIEALTAEMMLAAQAAGVADAVLASLGGDWPERAAYNLERMATHGNRRAAEMEEAIKTLAALGVDPVMTRATVARQFAAAAQRPALAA